MKFVNEGEAKKVRIDDKYHTFATVETGGEIDLPEEVGKRYGFIPAELKASEIIEPKEEKKEKPKKKRKSTKGKAGKKEVETKQLEEED